MGQIEIPDFSALLVPGEPLKDVKAQPTGKADGVIYLGSLSIDVDAQQRAIELMLSRNEGKSIDVEKLPKSIPSLEIQAYRYLRPASPLWRAFDIGRRGYAFPNISPILATPMGKTIRDVSAELERPIQWAFCPTQNENSITTWKAVENANQPEHAGKWVVAKVPTEEFIWCVFYVASAK